MAFKLVNHIIRGQRFFVYKINEISYRERVFCIFDKELPFELSLRYKELSKSMEVAPIIGAKGGFQLQEKTNLEKTYNFRFESSEECQHNIDEVNKKKELIDEMLTEFTEDMMLLYNKKMFQKLNKNLLVKSGKFKI